MVNILALIRVAKPWAVKAPLLARDSVLQCCQLGNVRVPKPIKSDCHQAIICYGINYCIIPTKKVDELLILEK